MSLVFSDATRSARAQATIGQLDKAATPGRLELYATTQPAAGAAPGGSPMRLAARPWQRLRYRGRRERCSMGW